MKKLLVIVSCCWIVGCASNETKPAAEEKSASSASNGDYAKGLALVAKSDCFTCHKVSEKLVGPAYEEVAAKYTMSDALIDTLAQNVIKGSVGKWGEVPMTAHLTLPKEDAKTMVKYIMSLKK